MQPGRFKCSLGDSTGAWEVQMEPGRSKLSLGCPNGNWRFPNIPMGVTFDENPRLKPSFWCSRTLLLMRILDCGVHLDASGLTFNKNP